MKVKEGDSVICILDFYGLAGSLVHKKGNIYELVNILCDNGIEMSNKYKINTTYFLISTGNFKINRMMWYPFDEENFNKHFCTIREYRKLKLERINGSKIDLYKEL